MDPSPGRRCWSSPRSRIRQLAHQVGRGAACEPLKARWPRGQALRGYSMRIVGGTGPLESAKAEGSRWSCRMIVCVVWIS